MAEVMHGKPVAAAIEARVAREVAETASRGVVPRIDVILVGTNPASQRYVRRKLDACVRLGMRAELHTFEGSVGGGRLRDEVVKLGADPEVHGILVQLPLPRAVEEPPPGAGTPGKYDIFDAIPEEKDVDGLSRHTLAELYRGRQEDLLFLPATALAVRRMLAYYRIPTKGKTAVVVGRNDITAKPVLMMLGGRMCDATAVWCHRHTPQAEHDALMGRADLVVTSVGNESYRLTGDLLKPGAVVIDIGTRVDAAGKMHGDADFESVANVASFVTPVPGGLGPVTVAALTENLSRAARFAAGIGRRGYEF
jgi:methylenetetrahydrofolate dehydrogenase (NADP+)/methenyltetrahydrofolate cyclohydrolase